MGVPAFFRWLSQKYPSVICDCIEDKARHLPNGRMIPVDTSQPNPNGVEFDNLYLDMNGIIHPCTHPEDRPAPKNEDEMMVAIFEFIDRIFAIVRPRKLLYMAIDGVAPRAKMNQQRSRRFRASKETAEKIYTMDRIRDELQSRGAYVPEKKEKGEHFDSNCITPGTPFMHRLSECLHYYIHDRLRNDPGWHDVMVILSDANVPGEGEHKIMDFIRRQRARPSHDPNTKHVLCGADADLIMLGLATHEVHFTIIREEFKPNKPRPCDICGQLGHDMKDCQGAEREKSGEHDEIGPSVASEQNFIFVRLYVLREYLERELQMPNLPFEYSLERAIDDWVFMCFFVGNDFLPHLPSLEIREGAIDRLIKLYKETVYKTKGWVTDSGFVEMKCVQMIMTELGKVEDEIFKKRQTDEVAFRQRMKNKRRRMEAINEGRPAYLPQGQFAPRAVGRGYNNPSITNAHQEIITQRTQAFVRASDGAGNTQAAMALRAMLRSTSEVDEADKVATEKTSRDVVPAQSAPVKRKRETEESDEDDFSHDEVRLWEDGFKDRYYESKFGVSPTDMSFRSLVAREYAKGLCWVLQYYYQGVPSWKWYFPYHYAPFASDFSDILTVQTRFEKNTIPFNPLEQLMGVFPAASRSHVPSPWAELMVDPESPIIDFYPEDFKIDLNGKKYAWQGVALLPFVDEVRLKRALKPLERKLTEDEKKRNTRGESQFYVGKHHSGYQFLRGLMEGLGPEDKTQEFDLDPSHFSGVSGTVMLAEKCVPSGGELPSPVRGLEPIYDCHVVCCDYRDPMPEGDFVYPAIRLKGSNPPLPQLKPQDFDERNNGPYRPRIGMGQMNTRASLGGAGHRMLGHHNQYSNGPQRPPRPQGPNMGYQPRGPRPTGGQMSSAAAYFDMPSHPQSRNNAYDGRGERDNVGRDWNRPSWSQDPNARNGRGGGGGGYPPRDNYNRGGYGGYNAPPPNRYSNAGPPASSNIRGGYYQQPQQPPRPRAPGPPQPPRGNAPSSYGYYTAGYQGRKN